MHDLTRHHYSVSKHIDTDNGDSATLTGGILGGTVGSAAGALGVWAAGRRYPAFRGLTLPLRAFLVTSAGTFAGE